MLIASLDDQLFRDEGRKLMPYQDSIRKLWSIGVGHLLGPILPPVFAHGITDPECDALYGADRTHEDRLLDVYIPWWRTIDAIRREVIQNAGFNLGVPKLCTFHQFLGYMRAQSWQAAAADLATTEVFHELPDRYGRLRVQILTGVRQ